MPNYLMERRNITSSSGGSQRGSREEVSMYSPQSILHAMQRFQSAVGAMENSVLVPCRLQDIPDPVTGDLYAAFKLLSRTKVDLLFGDENSQNTSRRASGRPTLIPQQQISSNGANSKPSENGSSPNGQYGRKDSLEDGEKDCGEGEVQAALDPAMVKLHANLNQNLKNLYAILEQMTDAADRVTNMYLEEVGGH